MPYGVLGRMDAPQRLPDAPSGSVTSDSQASGNSSAISTNSKARVRWTRRVGRGKRPSARNIPAGTLYGFAVVTACTNEVGFATNAAGMGATAGDVCAVGLPNENTCKLGMAARDGIVPVVMSRRR